MIKKLDKLIIQAFLGPFIATFFIAFFVLMMQTLWKYLDDLVGKGLDFFTICQFLWYASASMLVLAMPIAILLSTIMTFGNLGERFELVAIKSAGISLLRFMRPLLYIALLLCGITFLFSNYIIPYANLKFTSLYSDIYIKKPAFDLKEGVFFTHIPGNAIKIGKKDPDGKTIHHVIIFQQENTLQDNCIVAEKGVMSISEDENYLEFNLENGYRYQEKGNFGDSATEFSRVGFKTFKKLFDLSILKKRESSDSMFRKNSNMLNVGQLRVSIDSLKRQYDSIQLYFTNKEKLLAGGTQMHLARKKIYIPSKKNYTKLIPDSLQLSVNQRASEKLNILKSDLQDRLIQTNNNKNETKMHLMEWHRKYSLSLACLVLFFIGAPLGAIIRKGGLGMPLLMAIIFFLIFHLTIIFGQKFVKEDVMSMIPGMWLPIIVLVPVGGLLTYKAMHDSELFNREFYDKLWRRIFRSQNA